MTVLSAPKDTSKGRAEESVAAEGTADDTSSKDSKVLPKRPKAVTVEPGEAPADDEERKEKKERKERNERKEKKEKKRRDRDGQGEEESVVVKGANEDDDPTEAAEAAKQCTMDLILMNVKLVGTASYYQASAALHDALKMLPECPRRERCERLVKVMDSSRGPRIFNTHRKFSICILKELGTDELEVQEALTLGRVPLESVEEAELTVDASVPSRPLLGWKKAKSEKKRKKVVESNVKKEEGEEDALQHVKKEEVDLQGVKKEADAGKEKGNDGDLGEVKKEKAESGNERSDVKRRRKTAKDSASASNTCSSSSSKSSSASSSDDDADMATNDTILPSSLPPRKRPGRVATKFSVRSGLRC